MRPMDSPRLGVPHWGCRTLLSAITTAALIALPSCGGDSGTGPTQTPPDRVSVVISPSSLSILVGETAGVSATVLNGSSAVTWRSSNTDIVEVFSDGRVLGMGPGSATVTATSVQDPNASSSVPVTVTPPLTEVSVVPSNQTMSVGETYTFSASVTGPQDTRVTWTTSASSVATVDGSGFVRAVGPGTASIRATSVADPGASAAATVTVTGPPTSVTIVVTNQLLNPINVEVNGIVRGSVDGGDTRQTTVPYSTSLAVSWTLIRSTTSQGTPVGDDIGGDFSVVTNPGSRLSYTVDAVIGDTHIFRPQIVNQTAVALLMGVNEGLQAQNRCNCVVSAFSSGTEIGYYLLYSNSNVRAYRQSNGYAGGYLYWDDFANSVNSVTGSIRLTATQAPSAAGAARIGPLGLASVPDPVESGTGPPRGSNSDDVFRVR